VSSRSAVLKILAVSLALFALLAMTYLFSQMDLGWASTPVALSIATAKAALVIMYFMHLGRESGPTRAAALAGLFWLAILMGLVLADYGTRSWLPLPGHWPAPHGPADPVQD
jgi:cytochrome c oxidase subunit 4